ACPLWPGQPISAHWGIDDPAAAQGTDEDKRSAFFRAFNELQNRLLVFVSLPLTRLNRHALQRSLDEVAYSGLDDGPLRSHRALRWETRREAAASPGSAVDV